jgi:hypothetical protein
MIMHISMLNYPASEGRYTYICVKFELHSIYSSMIVKDACMHMNCMAFIC